MFEITKVRRISIDTVEVLVTMEAKLWGKYKRSGWLGSLYGIDISNAVYKLEGIKAICPSVGDRDRAINGYKTISLCYYDTAWIPAINNVINVDFKKRERVA